MEVDCANWRLEADAGSVSTAASLNSATDGVKFAHLKAFVTAAREFEATHSEAAVSLMSRYLGLIASSCDLSVFCPGRSEVCAFFSALWRVMADGRAPRWAGVAVLARAAQHPSARHALTHTYKFMPILAGLLSDSISFDKKLRLLSVMQDVTYGIKISWQESYLPSLLKQLTDWVRQPMAEPSHRTVGHRALTVLVNVCYGNLPAVYTLMRTVDTKEFVVHLISMKEGGYGGVEVCRLLLCLSGASRGAAGSKLQHVHSYLACATNTLNRAILERDSMQLLHSCTFLNDLCSDSSLTSHVLTYPDFAAPVADAIKDSLELCDVGAPTGDSADVVVAGECLQHILNFLTVLTKLDLFALRTLHSGLVELCLKASRHCLPAALDLFAALLSQYKEEGRLPQELVLVVSDVLPSLLVPPSLEPGVSGLQWLQVLGALCESADMQERLLRNVTAESFEDTLYCVLQHAAQNGAVGSEQAQRAVVVGCRVGLALAPLCRHWDAALARLLAHHQVRKVMGACLSGASGARRRQVLQLVKHPHFPPDKINQVFDGCETLNSTSELGMDVHSVSRGALSESGVEGWAGAGGCTGAAGLLMPAQEHALDQLIAKLNNAVDSKQISDVATSSVMELYGYKMSGLEQRLHSHAMALQGATEHMASLQHSLAMLQATNSGQQDVLYTTQMQNEKYKETIDKLHAQLADAEKSLRGFRGKLASERLDKENQLGALASAHLAQIASLESDVRQKEREIAEKERGAELLHAEVKGLKGKLEQQSSKNSELAGVLVKFEERVKARDRRLEEAAAAEAALRRELEQREQTVKQLEKTVLERENRLYQVTGQLEEMKRVQDMVAKLMSSNKAAGS